MCDLCDDSLCTYELMCVYKPLVYLTQMAFPSNLFYYTTCLKIILALILPCGLLHYMPCQQHRQLASIAKTGEGQHGLLYSLFSYWTLWCVLLHLMLTIKLFMNSFPPVHVGAAWNTCHSLLPCRTKQWSFSSCFSICGYTCKVSYFSLAIIIIYLCCLCINFMPTSLHTCWSCSADILAWGS